MLTFKTATALECNRLAGKFYNFILEAKEPLIYKPGQYISVKVVQSRINCYSIATDEGGNKFGLLIDTSPGGPGSKYFENLKPGDEIQFLGPFGTFIYRPDETVKNILFLGTGCGCAPLRRLIDNLLKEQNIKIPITFYFGIRYSTDVFWKDYFTKLSKEYPNFKFILVISQPDASCQEKTGHITDQLNQDFSNLQGSCAYLCGNISMVEEAIKILISKGVASEKIYKERI